MPYNVPSIYFTDKFYFFLIKKIFIKYILCSFAIFESSDIHCDILVSSDNCIPYTLETYL